MKYILKFILIITFCLTSLFNSDKAQANTLPKIGAGVFSFITILELYKAYKCFKKSYNGSVASDDHWKCMETDLKYALFCSLCAALCFKKLGKI